MTQHNKEQQRLIGQYEKFDPTIQQILQVAAVCDPLARTNLIQLASKVGVRHKDGSVPNYKKDGNAINATIETGVLEYVGNSKSGSIQPAVLIDDYMFRQAFSSGLAQRVNEKIKSESRRGYSYSYGYGFNENEAIRNMRFAFYGNDWPQWRELVRYNSFRPRLLTPYCQKTLEALSPEFQADFLKHGTFYLVNLGDPAYCDLGTSSCDLIDGMKKSPDDVIVAATDLLTAQGNIAGLEKLAIRHNANVQKKAPPTCHICPWCCMQPCC